MVFGWGKKKTEKLDSEKITQSKQISLKEAESVIQKEKNLRREELVSRTKFTQKKISTQFNQLSNIIADLENDDLKLEDVDKNIKTIVLRGKNQIIDIVKKETSTGIFEINSFQAVIDFNKEVNQSINKIGDVLGRNTRIVHTFAKKYANKMKNILSSMKSDVEETGNLLSKYQNIENEFADIQASLEKISSLQITIQELKQRIGELEDDLLRTQSDIERFSQNINKTKSTDSYLKYLELQKKLKSIENERYELKHQIDNQFSKISRPLSKYEYVTSVEKPKKILLEQLLKDPIDVLIEQNKDDIITVLQLVRKSVMADSISVKDTQKTLQALDETTESIDFFIQKVSDHDKKKGRFQNELNQLHPDELNQLEDKLAKATTTKQDIQQKISSLNEYQQESTKQIKTLIGIVEEKLGKIFSVKYQLMAS